MVQLKGDLLLPLTGKPDNTYWGLGDRWSTSSPTRRNDRARRKERGLLDYEQCRADELKRFVQFRGLNMPNEPSQKLSTNALRYYDSKLDRFGSIKNDYIAILQEADEVATFDKFLELPSEIRTIVYRKYFDDLPRLPELPHQPPVTLASKTLREGALPIFYEQCTFVLRFRENTHEVFDNRAPPLVLLYNTAEDPDHLTSDNLPASNLSHVSRLDLRLCYAQNFYPIGSPYHTHESGSWDIDLNGDAGPILRNNLSPGEVIHVHQRLGPYWAIRRQRLEPAMMKVLQEIWGRPGTAKFRYSDIRALRLAVLEALDPPDDV